MDDARAGPEIDIINKSRVIRIMHYTVQYGVPRARHTLHSDTVSTPCTTRDTRAGRDGIGKRLGPVFYGL